MGIQQRLGCCSVLAVVEHANESALPGVRYEMLVEFSSRLEFLRALRAVLESFLCVTSHVNPELSFPDEGLRAVRAGDWSVICMLSHVQLQSLIPFVTLWTDCTTESP